MDEPPRRRRIGRTIGIASIGLGGLLVLGLAVASVALQGERLGRLLGRVMPTLSGKLEARAIAWSPRLFLSLFTDAPVAIVIEGLRVTDPEGTEVLRVPRMTLKVRPRSAIGGKVILSEVKIGPGSFWRFAHMRTIPKTGTGIGFLRWFQVPPKPGAPPPPPPAPDAKPFVFQIVDADLAGLTAQFDFPGAWGLELRDVRGPASLLVDGDFVGWDGSGLDARAGGYLRILDDVLPLDRVQVRRVATVREAPDDILLDIEAARSGRSVVTAKGRFTGIYGYGVPPGQPEPPTGIAMHGEISDAADALAAVAARRKIEGLRIGGEGAKVTLDLHEPFERLKIEGSLAGLDVAYQTYEARRLETEFALDLGEPMAVTVQRLTFDSPGGGSFKLSGGLKGDDAQARLDFTDFVTDSYLPPAVRKLGAGTLRGGLHVAAGLTAKSLAIDGLDLRLDRRFSAGAPRQVRVFGRAKASPTAASTEGVTIELPGARLTVDGQMGLKRQLVGLALSAVADDLPRLLATMGLPPLAHSAALSLDVRGQMLNPTAHGSLTVREIALGALPPVGQVDARFGLEDGTAQLESLRTDAFGGHVEASGTAKIFDGSVLRRRRAPVVSAVVDGRQIDLAALVSGGAVQGHIDLHAMVQGATDALRATLTMPAGAPLNLFGQAFTLEGVEIESDLKSATIHKARLRATGGGMIDVAGRVALAGPLDLNVNVSDLSLAGLPGVADAGVPIKGRASLQLAVTGTLQRPLLRGDLRLTDVEARGVALGNGLIHFVPTDTGGVAASGDLFGRLTVAGTAEYGAAGPRLKASAAFHELALEQLLPEMRGFGEARGKLSGVVRMEMGGADPLMVEARLSQIELSAAGEPSSTTGQRPRLSLRNATELRVVMKGDRVTVDPTRLVTDGGEFRLSGELDGQRVAAELAGNLNLELLQPFVSERLESLGGQVNVALQVSGSLPHPQGNGSITIARPVHVKLSGLAPIISLPSGVIHVDPAALTVTNLAVEAERARLVVQGRAGLDHNQRPTDLDLTASGAVSGALLEALAGGAISDASGRATVTAHLQGTAAAPQVSAKLELAGLGFRLRDLGRDVDVEHGTVELDTHEIRVFNLEAQVDGQGRLAIGGAATGPGRIAIRQLMPTLQIGAVNLPLTGRRLTFRASNSVEMDDLGLDLTLSGDPSTGFQVGGEVLVASGRYVRDFTVRNLVISPSIDESEVDPFYAASPLLANLALDLRLRTVGDSFTVQNNLAPELHMLFDLYVHGTLAKPLIAGEVRPTDGHFHIFGVRGNFDLVPNVNYVTFVDTKSIDRGETPELNLEAQSTVTDSASREHVVSMRISGPIGQAQIDLSTDTGLDRNQALLLLISGHTSEEDASFGGARNPTLGANVRTGTDVIGQISRDSVADLLEPYVDDTLHLLTGGKLNLRPTFGPDGFELRVDARFGRQFDFRLSLLRGLENRRQYRVESNLWVLDYLSLRGLGEQVTYTPQEDIVENAQSLRLELTLDYPIRLLLR